MKMFNLLAIGVFIFAVASVVAVADPVAVVENPISAPSMSVLPESFGADFTCLGDDKDKDKEIEIEIGDIEDLDDLFDFDSRDRREFGDRDRDDDDDDDLDDLFDFLFFTRLFR